MEGKVYYTPTIDEFYVGFEFEMDDTWGEYKKLVLTEDLLKNPMVSLGGGNERIPYYWKTRVKYLDKDDIEECGFIYIKSQAGLTEDYFELISTEWCIDYDYSTHYCRIFMDNDGDSTFFAGTIKNKSELKKLLKQLNIN